MRTTLQTITLRILGLLFLLSGCTTVKNGVVVGKGSRVEPSLCPPIENYWVDVRGLDESGVKITERVLLYKRDWQKIWKGTRITPADYGVVDLPTAIRRFALGETPRPKETARNSDGRVATVRKGPTPIAGKSPGKVATVKSAPTPEEEFRAVEARAAEDAVVREAKRRIHSATTPEEQSRAWEEYRSTLVRKMRELGPSLSERIDKAESAK